LFKSDEEVVAFLTGADEAPTRQLFGDIPATFPTIAAQIRAIPTDDGPRIDVLMINGSVNDADFEQILDPQGLTASEIDMRLTQFGFEAFRDLLIQARSKCPNAVMIVPGYFPPFASGSNSEELEDMAEFLSREGAFLVAVNAFLTSTFGKLTLLGVLGDIFGLTQDVGDLVRAAIRRSEYASARALMSMRRAVTEVIESGQGGPGIIVAHAAFGPENAVFGDTPFLHQGYRAPTSETRPVQDKVLQARLDAPFARVRFLGRLGDAIEMLNRRLILLRPPNSQTSFPEEEQAFVSDLLNDLDGPTSLRAALTALLADFGLATISPAIEALRREHAQLRTARMASFLHPNEAGAQRYADVIVERYARHRKLAIRTDLGKLATLTGKPPAATLRVGQTLRRYGLDPGQGLRACFQYMVVDSLAVETVVAQEALAGGLFPENVPLTIALGVRQFTVASLQRPFAKADATDLFAIDTLGELHLGDIDRLEVRDEFDVNVSVGPGNTVLPVKLDLTSVRLFVNGKVVFQAPRSAATKVGDRLVFRYPG
jgi:hypothetical protein